MRVEVPAEAQLAPSLTDAEALELGRFALAIEEHYSTKAGRPTPMDIEWAQGRRADGRLYILQARPETVHRAERRAADRGLLARLDGGLASGWSSRRGHRPADRASGRRGGSATHATSTRSRPGEVLVASMTDPDWEPIMKRAAAIVTDRGGRTCHAAIVSRELGVPCVVGTGNGTELLAGRRRS